MNHNDILFTPSEPLDIVSAVARRVKELRPDWITANEYPGYVGLYLPDGQQFHCGTVNGTWDADYYPAGKSEPETGFRTGIEGDSRDVERIASSLVEDVEEFLERPRRRSDFIASLKAFRKAAFALSSAYDELSQEDNGLTGAAFPFADSFDEVALQIDHWVGSVEEAFKNFKA